jgi:myo-inositol-hexaphosphate 3-phosphohydrolase
MKRSGIVAALAMALFLAISVGMSPLLAATLVTASVETTPVVGVGDAADDPAIWIHPSDPSLSTVIGTDKTGGGLAVYDLAGAQLQFDATVKPNNVDLRYNFPLGGNAVALVGFSNKRDASIGTFVVNPLTRQVENAAARVVKPSVSPSGFCLYRSPVSGKYYAFVVSSGGTVEQWELFDNGTGKIDGTRVRTIVVGTSSPTGTVAEGCTTDDTYGDLYVSEERVGIWKYGAEPGAGDTRTLVDAAVAGHITPDVEGLAIYSTSSGGGYLIASSQGSSEFVIYDRITAGFVGSFKIGDGAVDGVSHTDGIDVTNFPLGSAFPSGMFVAQDDANPGANQNFKYVSWASIANSFTPALTIDTTWDPRLVGGGGGGNRAPTVNAGPDQTVLESQAAVLDARVFDDGLPSGTLSTSWSAVSGPPGATVGFADPTAVDTTATFSALGTYVLQLTADDGERRASDTLTVTVASTATLDAAVASSFDDAEESAAGAVSLTSSDLELVSDGSNQTVGLRFSSIALPRGATIRDAYVQFEADEVTTGATSLTIRGQAADNASTFTTATSNISSRPRTTQSVGWLPSPWPTVQVHGAAQRTPNLSGVIQEIVNRPGWASGNALAIVITGTGKRTAEAFNGTFAPVLHVEFGFSGTPTNAAPTVDGGPDQQVVFPAAATLSGSVSDDGRPNPPGTVTARWTQVSGPGTASFADPASPATTVSFSAPGSYVLQLAGDDGALQTSDTVTIVASSSSSFTIEVRVAASSDDAEESATGTVSLSSSDLELVTESSIQTVGVRFTAVGVPRGATITNAYVQFEVDAVTTGTTSLTVRGQAADNAPTFTTATRNISTRPRTLQGVGWVPAPWPTVQVHGPDQRTPDLSAVIQEVVNRSGWTSGNALAIIITGSGKRTAEAFNGTFAPILHVEYR